MSIPFSNLSDDDSTSDISMDDIQSQTTNSQNTFTVPKIDHAPKGHNTKPTTHSTTIKETPFAIPYRSPFLLQQEHQHLIPLLQHLNCSYLSTPGIAPSLTQLKAHAQSLCILIQAITLSTKNSVINIKNQDLDIERQTADAIEGETWDWLNDLSKPYTGPQEASLQHTHNLPLTALLNTQQFIPDASLPSGLRQEDHCPLYHPRPSDLHTNGTSLPYATHQALIAHANRVLELLDHEYSAKGGLLSILPPESSTTEREQAESTLLGQHILWTQRLVSRLHELEREYSNALDICASESLTPHQMLSKLGPEGRKGRQICYPQDRFVLVNAGQDVWDFLDQEFRERERVDEVVKEGYLRDGAMGQALWAERGGKEYLRGITAVDITTRYFRLRNDPLKTVFVIPAWERHPGVKATVEMEKVPTVVSVSKPVWPERQSLWEQRERGRLEEVKRLEREVQILKQKEEWAEEEKKVLYGDNERKDGLVRHLTKERDTLQAVFESNEVSAAQKKFYKDYQSASRLAKRAKEMSKEAKRRDLLSAEKLKEAESAKGEMEKMRRLAEQQQREIAEQRSQSYEAASQRVAQQDRDAGVSALELERKLKEVLGGQVKEAQVIIEWLRSRKVSFEGDLVREEAVEKGRMAGQSRVDEAMRGVSFVSLGGNFPGAGYTVGGPTRGGTGGSLPRGGGSVRGRTPFGGRPSGGVGGQRPVPSPKDGPRPPPRGPTVEDA